MLKKYVNMVAYMQFGMWPLQVVQNQLILWDCSMQLRVSSSTMVSNSFIE